MDTIMQHAGSALHNHHPERILQIGEGNFLRAFAAWMINSINNENGAYEGSIVLCQPTPRGHIERFAAQNCLYNVAMRGLVDGKPTETIDLITSVSRCINPYSDYAAFLALARSEDLQVVISNTTEAGISYDANAVYDGTPQPSYPAKLTAFLYERYLAFRRDAKRGLLILPCELIDENGTKLREIVLRRAQDWSLEAGFVQWLDEANQFANTLVDRIVTGFPREQISLYDQKLGYRDELLVTCEPFDLWVIEADEKWKEIFPIEKGKGNVIWTDNVAPYKQRKVRLLNGGHTATALAAYLAGHDTVCDFMRDPLFHSFLTQYLFRDTLPTLDLPQALLKSFASAVLERFSNPYIKHRLLDISLNSISKFSARCLPTMFEYFDRFGTLPGCVVFGLAALIRFYDVVKTEDGYVGHREDGSAYPVRDDEKNLEFFCEVWKSRDLDAVVRAALSNAALWGGCDLSQIPELATKVGAQLHQIEEIGIRIAIGAISR